MKRFRNVNLIAAVFLLVVSAQTASAGNSLTRNQNKKIKITGIVTDANMNPVPGARIFVDQASTSSVTNSKGFYRVKVAPSTKQISAFSPIYGVQKIAIKSDMTALGKAEINIVLAQVSDINAEPQPLEDEKINIGYGTVSKKNLTTEVNKVTRRRSYQTYNNVYDMIRGEVPGVEVNGKTIRIRDAFSFYLNTEPLLVIDGMNVPSLDDISPFDVKSIEVLKGAAASVYGSRGANGVILITTMKGGDKR